MARQREFDEREALDAAMRVFWSRGYDGASLSDLTAAMGISRPSLYAAFGNKEALYKKALGCYAAGPGAGAMGALEAPTALEVVERLLRFTADAAGDKGRPRGCFLVNGALRCSDEGKPAERETRKVRVSARAALQRRFEEARRAGEKLPGSPAELARWVWTISNGMAIDATDGATPAELRAMVRRALADWKKGLESG